MDRRQFLRHSGIALTALGVGGGLAACAQGGDQATAAIPDGPPELSATVAMFEVLTGTPQTVLFGLRTIDNVEVPEGEVSVFVRDESGEEILQGPLSTEYVEAPGTGLGLYRVELEFDEPGNPQLVAVHGDRYGAAALRVVEPENSAAPVPGQDAQIVATPTQDTPLGYESICTADPPCGMHEMSLEEAAAAGRPVMLAFATPEFCQTVVCGPAVETIDGVRSDGDWGDTAWIHVEIYSKYDASAPELGEPVQQWNLPTEPWLFSIDSEGTIVSRLDGPMLPEDIEAMAQELTA